MEETAQEYRFRMVREMGLWDAAITDATGKFHSGLADKEGNWKKDNRYDHKESRWFPK